MKQNIKMNRIWCFRIGGRANGFFIAMFVCNMLMPFIMITLIPSIVVRLPFVNAGDNTIGNLTLILEMVQLCVLLGSIVPVENALKHTFDEKGVRR